MMEDRKKFEGSSLTHVIASAAKQSPTLGLRLLRRCAPRNDIRQTSNFRLASVCGASSVALFTLLPVLLLAGCRNRELDQAQQEAREAKATINKLNYSLKTAQEKIATVEAELSSVKQNRDDLQKQVDRLNQDRDQASTSVRQAQEAITRLTTQAAGQGSLTAALQKQIAELNTLVEDQRKLIEQLKKEAPSATLPPAQPADKPTTPDPNGKP